MKTRVTFGEGDWGLYGAKPMKAKAEKALDAALVKAKADLEKRMPVIRKLVSDAIQKHIIPAGKKHPDVGGGDSEVREWAHQKLMEWLADRMLENRP